MAFSGFVPWPVFPVLFLISLAHFFPLLLAKFLPALLLIYDS